MRKLSILTVFFLLFSGLDAQVSPELGKIALSVVMPENLEGLNESQLSRLQTKITQIVTAGGVAASGYDNNFVIYPKFAINETRIVESGMQDMTMINCDISLFIKQVENNLLFGSMSKTIKGNGKDLSLAITSAINQINTNDWEYSKFIETGKNKILNYYESKCNDIIARSQTLANLQNFEEAIGILMNVPEEASGCYSRAQAKSLELYKRYQDLLCASLIQKAKVNIAANYYNAALEILSQIDPASKCVPESQTLIKKIEPKVDAEQRRIWAFRMQMYKDKVALEKLRINAMKEIAIAYYRSKTKRINYNIIVL